ncbi:MAG: flagellar hook-associated protein FlgL [Ignavibacteriaceae bacterium]
MRISDILMNNSFINNISKTKERINKLSIQIATSTRVHKPSDSPVSAAKILRLGTTMSQNDNYAKNVANGQAIVNETTFALEAMQTEISGILTKMTELNNAANETNYKIYAEQIDLALKSILDAANSQSDGKYIFGGTDHSVMPYGYTSGQGSIETKAGDVSGKQYVKMSSNILQKINMTGTEIFGTVLTGSGNLDSSAAIGSVYTVNNTVYNSSKEEYNLTLNYTKTAANTYSLTYDVLDSTSTSIYASAPAAVEVTFDPATGEFTALNGRDTSFLKIQDSAHHLDFSIDMNFVNETSAASSISFTSNQKTDIFNTLLRVRNDLNNGIKPSDEDEQMIKNFNNSILDKISEAGNITNQLAATEELLINQKSVLQGLMANEQEVDVAKAIMELQNQDYMLQLAYQVSAKILPKSLLDYI